MNSRYDFDKETDRDFLREAGKALLEKVITLEIKLTQLMLEKTLDEEIKNKLTGELLVLRRRIFDKKQEKKEKLKSLKKEKKRKKVNLLHNQNENKQINENEGKELNLTSEEHIHELKSDKCEHCASSGLQELSNFFEESSEFDINKTFYVLKRHKRKKYKCPHCYGLSTAPGPDKLVPGGQFSVQLATEIACEKFERHLPLERQRIKMKQLGLVASTKTLFSITEHLYALLFELNEMNRLDILQGPYVCLDESPQPFFNPEKSNGYVWSLSNNRGVYYQFEATRSGNVAREMIKGFKGIVVTDGYGGYGFLSTIEGIIHVYCWAHMRRYFFDAMAEDARIGILVDYVDELYEIEHMAQGFSDLKYLRASRSTLIVQKICDWVSEHEGSYLSSTLPGKAITYFLNQKEGLLKFLANEYIPLDNNMAERRQRCPVMGRKNFLTFRSINGADVGMYFYSMIESCKSNGLIPSVYLLEMALRKLRGEKLETPFQYASNLREQMSQKLENNLKEIPRGTR